MPYILLVIGLIIATIVLYRFFLSASPAQIKAAFTTAALAAIVTSIILLAITGRLPAAIALVAALAPFAVAYWRGKKVKGNLNQNKPDDDNVIDAEYEEIDDDDLDENNKPS